MDVVFKYLHKHIAKNHAPIANWAMAKVISQLFEAPISIIFFVVQRMVMPFVVSVLDLNLCTLLILVVIGSFVVHLGLGMGLV